MHPLSFLFSPSGRLLPQTFVIAAIGVYLAGAASQFLTTPTVIAAGGLWAFAAVQALLIWVWFCLHARRLHDAGRASGIALGAALLYALSVVLLLIIAAAFIDSAALGSTDANSNGTLGLLMLLLIFAALLGAPHYDFVWLIVTILTAMAFMPIIVALAVTQWAATRPSVPPSAP